MPSVVSVPETNSLLSRAVSPGQSRASSVFSPTPNTYDYNFKIITLGMSGVGKSSLSLRYTTGDFREKYNLTVGMDYSWKFINVNNKKLHLQLWETCGQDRFREITAQYVRKSDGVILAYDTTHRKSFDELHNYIDLANTGAENAIKILVGCKADLTQERQISHREGQALAEKLRMSFFETSAKDASNVNAVFKTLCTQILERRNCGYGDQDESHSAGRTINLMEPTGKNETIRSKSCC